MATDDTSTRSGRKKAQIELTSLYWYEDRLPKAVELTQSSLKIPGVKSGMHGLYGIRGRNEGFVAARNHVRATGLNYTAIDFRVQLAGAVDLNKRSADNVQDHDIFPAHLLTREYAIELDHRLRSDLHMRRTPGDEQAADCLLRTLHQHPAALNTLMAYPEMEHIRLFIYTAKPTYSEDSLVVATVPEQHLDAIVAANCRLDPELGVTLPCANHSALQEKQSLAPSHKPDARPRNR